MGGVPNRRPSQRKTGKARIFWAVKDQYRSRSSGWEVGCSKPSHGILEKSTGSRTGITSEASDCDPSQVLAPMNLAVLVRLFDYLMTVYGGVSRNG